MLVIIEMYLFGGHMKKSLTDGFKREIIFVDFDESGERFEKDFDLLHEMEKQQQRNINHRKSLEAVGYKKIDRCGFEK